MTLPSLVPTGALIADLERSGRYLRVSSHPEAGRVVLSVWQDATCLGTLRLDDQSVVDLLVGLGRCLPTRDTGDGLPRTGTVAG